MWTDNRKESQASNKDSHENDGAYEGLSALIFSLKQQVSG